MFNAVIYPSDHPLMAAFVTAHGAVVKSPSNFARTTIKEYAKTHWQLDLDPDATRIISFTLSGPPAQAPYPATVLHSLTLTEALLHRYQWHIAWYKSQGAIKPYRDGGYELRLVKELDRWFPVHETEGLYRQSAPQVYNASTHVNIHPNEFRDFIKSADLRKHYQNYLKAFWAANAQHYPLLAKAAFIKAAFIQSCENSVLEADLQLALKAAGLPVVRAWNELTPVQLQAYTRAAAEVVVAPLKIHRYTSTDILLIKDPLKPRVLLYIPGNSSPLHGFENEHAMAEWLAEQCRDPRKRKALQMHFKDYDEHDGLFLSGLRTTLEGMAVYPHSHQGWKWSPRHLIHSGKAISGDPFVFVRDGVESRLRSDARSVIHSGGDARLQGIAEGLGNSLMFTGLIALIVPEAVPFIVGLSIALVGTGTAQIMQGKSLEDRMQGLQRLEFGVFNALPLAAGKVIELAAGTGESIERVETAVASAPKAEPLPAEAAQPEPVNPVRPRFDYEPPALRSLNPSLRQSLRTFEAPPASVQGQPTVHGPNGMLDIHHSEGRYFLSIHDKAYEVRWEAVARRWRVISPDGKGTPGPFVRQLESDQWDIDEGGLKGGMDPGPSAPTDEPHAAGPSLNAQVKALYPGFSQQQVSDFLTQLRANGTSIEIQLARLSMDYQSLERSLERWINGPLSWGPWTEGLPLPVSQEARRRAAEIIKRCWRRETPAEGVAARHIGGHMLNLAGIPMGDLPYLPGGFQHVTAINLSRTFTSHQSISALLGLCPDLRWLNLENNFLTVLPVGIRRVPQLTRLTMANNRVVLTQDMMDTLRHLTRLRLLNFESNPLGSLLDLRAQPQLINLFLRNTHLTTLPAGFCDLAAPLAVDLRTNLIRTLPEEFFAREDLLHHTLLDGNPLSAQTRGHLAVMGVPVLSQAQGDTVDFWLEQSSALDRARRRDIWDLFQAEEHATDFFEVIARLEASADFGLDRPAITERVWNVLEAGAVDESLRSRLIAMAAYPDTCVDGAAVIFGNMELEVLVNQARALAANGREGQSLLKLVRGLYRLEEVDAIAREDIAARVGFTEDVEVMLAYRLGLARRLELPVETRAMAYTDTADVPQSAIDFAEQAVLARENPLELATFALRRDFWVSYLENEYPDRFSACQRLTEQQMTALDDQQRVRPLSDGAYKEAADAIMRQRREDERLLKIELTLEELQGGVSANNV